MRAVYFAILAALVAASCTNKQPEIRRASPKNGSPISLSSGTSNGTLAIAFDKKTRLVTGYYEGGTGYDEETGEPQFSCIFYIKGILGDDNRAKIDTYFPLNANDDLIRGTLQVVNEKELKISLPKEHGGCWNVEHFADEPNDFELDSVTNWIQIRFANKDKVYFYSGQSKANKEKAYLVKGNIVYIDQIDGEWAHATYKDAKTTSGWIRMEDLNP